jgi:oligopeptide transport system ATP-binding protein
VPRLGVAYEEDVELPSIIGNVPSPNSLPPGCSFHPRCTDFHPGLCDASVPPYEECGTARRVRCLRWRELGGET